MYITDIIFLLIKLLLKKLNYNKLISELRKKNPIFLAGGCTSEIYNEKIFKKFLPKNELVNAKLLSKAQFAYR